MKAYDNGRPRILTRQEASDIAGDLTETEVEQGRLERLCLASIADEADTLTEASLMLRDFAEWLVELELDGWQLVETVEEGHGLVVNEDAEKRLSGTD